MEEIFEYNTYQKKCRVCQQVASMVTGNRYESEEEARRFASSMLKMHIEPCLDKCDHCGKHAVFDLISIDCRTMEQCKEDLERS